MSGVSQLLLCELHKIAMEAQRVIDGSPHRRHNDAADKARWDSVAIGLEKLMEADHDH